jgi:hypothetical protein
MLKDCETKTEKEEEIMRKAKRGIDAVGDARKEEEGSKKINKKEET